MQFQRSGPVSKNGEPATWPFMVCRSRALNVCRNEKRMIYLDEALIEAREEYALTESSIQHKSIRQNILSIIMAFLVSTML